jgi:hypothetical protein
MAFGPDLQHHGVVLSDHWAQGLGPQRRDCDQQRIIRVLAHPAVQVAIVGARIPAYLEESLGALDLALGQADLAEIDTIMAAAVLAGGPAPEGMS